MTVYTINVSRYVARIPHSVIILLVWGTAQTNGNHTRRGHLAANPGFLTAERGLLPLLLLYRSCFGLWGGGSAVWLQQVRLFRTSYNHIVLKEHGLSLLWCICMQAHILSWTDSMGCLNCGVFAGSMQYRYNNLGTKNEAAAALCWYMDIAWSCKA